MAGTPTLQMALDRLVSSKTDGMRNSSLANTRTLSDKS